MVEPNTTGAVHPSLGIVTPLFNDWASLSVLLKKLDEVAESIGIPVTVLVVNDGSPSLPRDLLESPPVHLAAVELMSLTCNLGHQRAIATGLAELVKRKSFSMILVMDGDGEDSPQDIVRLVQTAESQPSSIVVASRAKRSEGLIFRACYSVYKVAFHFLTGKRIDFGNFCLLPVSAAEKLAYTPDVWNHLAAAIVKSRLPIVRVPTTRGRRYQGKSSMNLVALVVHGFSAMSVFADTVLTRLFLLFAAICLGAVGTGLTAMFVRFYTDLAIPGWATNVFGLSVLLLAQSMTVLVFLVFSNLGNRAAIPFIPALQSAAFVSQIAKLWSRPAHASI